MQDGAWVLDVQAADHPDFFAVKGTIISEEKKN